MQQSRAQKEALVAEVAEKIKASKALVFANYKGVSVKDLTYLRKNLKEKGGSWQVLKKTLLTLALKDAGVDVNARELDGQIGVAFSEDEVGAAKVFATFLKENKETSLSLQGGTLGAKKLSTEEVKALAKIPGKEELLGMLVGTLAAPMSGLVRALSGNAQGLVQVLRQVAEKKQA